ncbi:hypothetical protein ACH5RR_015753 [Cinchona calisaya]|uniref:Uncharacterized protein n=1 Tax=Cinchona calisaya TaxID=153742 RepID=A0ABD2ZUX5_9GENT
MEALTLKEKLKHAETLAEKKNQVRLKIVEKLKQKQWDRDDISMQLEWLPMKYFYVGYNRNEIQYLQRALDEYNRADELVIQIKCLFHELKSGRNSLAEEKRILKEIKCVQEQKETFCADVEAKKWIPSQLGEALTSKESIKSHLDLIFEDLIEASKQQKKYNSEADQLKKKKAIAEKTTSCLRKKLEKMQYKIKNLDARIHELRRCMEHNA